MALLWWFTGIRSYLSGNPVRVPPWFVYLISHFLSWQHSILHLYGKSRVFPLGFVSGKFWNPVRIPRDSCISFRTFYLNNKLFGTCMKILGFLFSGFILGFSPFSRVFLLENREFLESGSDSSWLVDKTRDSRVSVFREFWGIGNGVRGTPNLGVRLGSNHCYWFWIFLSVR